MQAVEAPFYCPAGAGKLARDDLQKLFELVEDEGDPSDPPSALWFLHLSLRLHKALGRDRAKRYIELIRRVKTATKMKPGRQPFSKKCPHWKNRPFRRPGVAFAILPSPCRTTVSCAVDAAKHSGTAVPTVKRGTGRRLTRSSVEKSNRWRSPMRELQALRPATFQAPPDAQVREVQAEVLVKVCVEGFERFWVQVEQVAAHYWSGQQCSGFYASARIEVQRSPPIPLGECLPGDVSLAVRTWISLLFVFEVTIECKLCKTKNRFDW